MYRLLLHRYRYGLTAAGCLLLLLALLLMQNSSVVESPTDPWDAAVDQRDLDQKLRIGLPQQGCPLYFHRPAYYSQSGEDRGLFIKYFSNPILCNGTFVELGALDGITYSNTLFFEEYLGWTGVLIEAEPENAKKLKMNRARHTSNYGMAICAQESGYVEFAGTHAVGGVISEMTDEHYRAYVTNESTVVRVPCTGLGKLLRQAGVTKVDLLSLDVEGAELTVLNTMDWDIPVRVMVIEMGHGDDRDTSLVALLQQHGYTQAPWDIRSFCQKNQDCGPNVVFENSRFPQRK